MTNITLDEFEKVLAKYLSPIEAKITTMEQGIKRMEAKIDATNDQRLFDKIDGQINHQHDKSVGSQPIGTKGTSAPIPIQKTAGTVTSRTQRATARLQRTDLQPACNSRTVPVNNTPPVLRLANLAPQRKSLSNNTQVSGTSLDNDTITKQTQPPLTTTTQHCPT